MNWNQSPQLPMSTPGMGDTTALSGIPMQQSPAMNTGIFSREGMFGQAGWVNPMIGAVSAGTQLWQGMQQVDLMKDQLAFQKETFAKNWANQVQLTNQRLYDRYSARQSGYGQEAKSKGEYLATEGVK